MKILVAEDSRASRLMLTRLLTKWGYEVIAVEDGQQAVAALGDIRLVISDWEMPNLDGPGLCRYIRSAERADYVYIILLSGRYDPEHVILGHEAGADDFIGKPFDLEQLRARLEVGARVLEERTSTR